MGLASIGGRLVGGWLLDTFDVRRLAIFAALASTVFPACLILAPGVAWVAMLALIFHALTGGMKIGTMIYLTSSLFGPRSFGLFFGIVGLNTSLAMGLGPLLANHLYDLTQSYWPVVWAAIPGFLITAAMFTALTPAPDFTRTRRKTDEA